MFLLYIDIQLLSQVTLKGKNVRGFSAGVAVSDIACIYGHIGP
jgi:hypothetical protein